MAFFKKNSNESAYVNGEKHFTDVIKNSGSNDLLVWKQPEEDFNTNSTLIVNPGETAIFIKDGAIEKTFQNGKYILDTENYPFISRLRNSLSGGISTFNCFVYFVKSSLSKEVKWGTSSPISVMDKEYNILIEFKSRGAYRVKVSDPGLFLHQIVGSNIQTFSPEDLNDYLYNQFSGKIKAIISTFLNKYEGSLVGLDQYLPDISADIKPELESILMKNGLTCDSFAIQALDGDFSAIKGLTDSVMSQYRKLNEAKGDKIAQITHAEGQSAEMNLLGKNWDKLKNVEIMKDVANNPNSGGIANLGAGLGLGLSSVNAFKSRGENVANDATESSVEVDYLDKIKVLKSMLDQELISKEIYDKKVSQLIDEM